MYPLVEKSLGETNRVSYLDGWRGIAIILVLFHHFGEFRNLGRTGVDFFFVLSGLLMSRILFVDKMPLGTFYKRRIARIFPVFNLYLLVSGAVFTLYLPALNKDDLLYSALFLRTYFPGDNILASDKAPISQLWSLHVEEHCYVLLSIISLSVLRRSENFARYMVTAAAFACIAFFACYKIFPPVSQSPLSVRSECAGFGLLISSSIFLWLRHLRINVPRWVPVLSVLAGTILGISFQYGPLKVVVSPLLLAISVNTINVCPHSY
jgi:peptidoglycan/LPS O-acetylase OafA/YrhL